jgi:GT2 family glycosyltransferase
VVNPSVAIIITAWNQLEKTLACLESVVAQTYPHLQVILVDNGSAADFGATIAASFPAVTLIRNETNLGFAGGYNTGLRRALAEDSQLFFLLNNDTLLAPDCLAQLVTCLQSQPDAGMATAKLYYAHRYGDETPRIWSVGNRLHPLLLERTQGGDDQLDLGQWETVQKIDFAPFCGLLLRRKVVERVGWLDEQFFLYYEDMDYCLRVREAGFRLLLCPAARIWHDVSTSSGGRDSPLKRYWLAQSSGRYFRKHGWGWRMLFILPFRLGSALKTSGSYLRHRRWQLLQAYWSGLITGWRTGRSTTPPPAWLTRRLDRPLSSENRARIDTGEQGY